MTRLNQIEMEERMTQAGIVRTSDMIEKAEKDGRAHQNPYAKELYQTFVMPVADVVREDYTNTHASNQHAAARLLSALDPEAVSFLAVRTVMSRLLDGQNNLNNHRTLAYEVGRIIHCELVLVQIEAVNPALYHTLTSDFQRRLSKDARHRMTVFKRQAKAAGIEWVEWPKGSRDQVGIYLLGLLESVGMIEIEHDLPGMRHHRANPYRNVILSAAVIDRVNTINEYVSMTMPVYGPCVEPPLDFTTTQDGGYHTPALRRVSRGLVRCGAVNRELYNDASMPLVFEAVNNLQRTEWQVHGELLDIVQRVAENFTTKEIVSLADHPKPPVPDWLVGVDRKNLPADKQAEFKAWKRTMTDWYEQRKLLGIRYGRFYSATRSASLYREYPSIWFVYFADSRGRLYPMTYGINPQGSDLQKALLRFAKGKPVTTPEAILWFKVQGANKWGFDKATLEERAAWAEQNRDLILSYAADPIANSGWTEADSPLQFLSWALEYDKWQAAPDKFLSHLPISMDGSCNGLQNLSALLRDSIGGRATNLTNNERMQDIYATVAKAAAHRLTNLRFEDSSKQEAQAAWLKHGIDRSGVKRSVMTTPYGVTRKSATEYVITDYLKEGKGPAFTKDQYYEAAYVLMSAVWPAIGDVVVKGREAMEWLKKCASSIIKEKKDGNDTIISWTTPSGFIASQSYYEAEFHRIKTRLHGTCQIKVASETDEPDRAKHTNGLAPNFVHSMDAAHLHLVAAEAKRQGIDSLAMIHDDYGTHAADSAALARVIRERFVWMYENHDPIQAFSDRYPLVPTPPVKGDLDIREVLQSKYFFS